MDLSKEKHFHAKRNQILMMIDRGFDPNSFDERDKKVLEGYTYPSEFLFTPTIYTNQRLQPFIQTDKLKCFGEPTISINVVFYYMGSDVKSVNPDEIHSFINDTGILRTTDYPGRKVITVICACEKVRTKVEKAINDLKYFNTQVFLFDEMIMSEIHYPPTKHFMIPSARKLTGTEIIKFKEDLIQQSLSIDQIPVILVGDIFAKYHGLFHGDVVEFHRPTFGDSIINITPIFRRVIGRDSDDDL